MRITILILLGACLVSGCATDGRYSASREFRLTGASLGECDGTGGTPVKLHYGFTGNSSTADNRIRMRGLVHLQTGEIFAIELKPKGNKAIFENVDFEDVKVTISGKRAKDKWLSAGPASYNDTAPDHEMTICVPSDLDPDHYYYNVEIEMTGSLDPRADVC